MSRNKIIFLFLLPVLLNFILHIHILKLDVVGVHSWRQTQTQTVIYLFNHSDNSILNPQRFDLTLGTSKLLYEFPLYQWTIAQVNFLLGYSVLNTRIISFLFFVVGLIGFFKLLRKFFSLQVSLITHALLCFSPLMFYCAFNPLPDTLALTFGIWSQYFFFEHKQHKRPLQFIFFALFLSLAALVKLPFVLFGSVLIPDFILWISKKQYSSLLKKTAILLFMLAPAIAWYIYAIPTWKGNSIVKGMLENNKPFSELLYFLQGNIISSVPEMLVNYAAFPFFLAGIYTLIKNRKQWTQDHYRLLSVFITLSFYFLYELNMIEDKHDYYLMPFLPILFFTVAKGVSFFLGKGFHKIALVLVMLVPVTASIRMYNQWDPESPGFNKGYITEEEKMQELIPKNSLCIVDDDQSHFIALYYLKRFGYSLDKNQINEKILLELYAKKAEYLITQNKEFDPGMYSLFNFTPLLSNGLKVYKLHLK